MLTVSRLCAGYRGLQVLWDVEISVGEGEWVALLGASGAGKTTLMRTISGLLPPYAGRLQFLGEDIGDWPPHRRVRHGISLVPEGRRLFAGMTVEENLDAGAFAVADKRATAERREWVYSLFPMLRERRKQVAGTLSGGEQQMCAIGRALMSQPRLLLIDELSLGLAPIVMDDLLAALVKIRSEGTALLVVEQDVEMSLAHAHRGYVMRQGSMVTTNTAAALLADPNFRRDYLGY